LSRRRDAAGLLLAPVVAIAALLVWPQEPPHATGAWMQRAGVSPRYLEAAGMRIRYVRKGSGPPLVLLHGFSSSIYTWAETLPLLAQEHDVVAVDLPGFGGSDIPTYFDAKLAAVLVPVVLDRLGLERASLAGNSLGGALAAVTAARDPRRVDRLVLIDAAAYNLAPADRPALLRMVGAVPVSVVKALPQRPMMRLGLKQVFFDDTRVTPERVEEYLAPMARPGALAAARQVLANAPHLGLPDALRKVRAPTLVIWGAQDAWIPPRDADRFLRDIPGARKVVLERCGHVPQEEQPAEVARVMLEFLAER
jgi:pimeloyl-ACP methyl ester carboxylesterase